MEKCLSNVWIAQGFDLELNNGWFQIIITSQAVCLCNCCGSASGNHVCCLFLFMPVCPGRSGLVWLACGPQLEVAHAMTGERLSAYCFSSGAEHPPSVLTARDFSWLKRSVLVLVSFCLSDINCNLWKQAAKNINPHTRAAAFFYFYFFLSQEIICISVFSQFYLDNWKNACEAEVFCFFILAGLDCWWVWRRPRAVCCVSMTWDCRGWSKLSLYQAGWVHSLAKHLFFSHL